MLGPDTPTCRRRRRAALLLAAAVICAALWGCDLGDSELVDCRCTPGSNAALFPCPQLEEVTRRALTATGDAPDSEVVWVVVDDSSALVRRVIAELGDTLLPATDWIVAHGDTVRASGHNPGDPLTTRMADCPSGQRLALREPTRPEFVVLNIKTIFEAQPQMRSSSQYMDQLADDFSFVPDEQDIEQHPEAYDVTADTLWNRDDERRFAQAILAAERIELVRFSRWYQSSTDQRQLWEDQLHETFYFPYEADITERTADDEPASVLAIKGWMEIDLVTPTTENPVWTVQQWRDRRDASTAKWSWGELRAEFAR